MYVCMYKRDSERESMYVCVCVYVRAILLRAHDDEHRIWVHACTESIAESRVNLIHRKRGDE